MLLPGVEELGVLLLGVEARWGALPVDGEGGVVGVLVEGDAVLEGDDWAGVWLGAV